MLALVLRCVAVCCDVLQCVAVCCGVAQCVAVCRSVSQYADSLTYTYIRIFKFSLAQT